MEKYGYEITKLRENLYQFDEGGVRVFLVVGEDNALLIDTGFGKGKLKKLVDEMTDKPVLLVQTHADGDHTGATCSFDRVLIHKDELPRFNKTVPCAEKLNLSFAEDGDTLSCGGYIFTVYHIPGHTDGSIALYEKNEHFIISGDSIQKGPIYLFGDGRDTDAFIDSMERMLTVLNEKDTVYPSHNETPVTAEILPDLIECVRKYKAGELSGTPPEADRLKGKCLTYGYNGVYIYGEIR